MRAACRMGDVVGLRVGLPAFQHGVGDRRFHLIPDVAAVVGLRVSGDAGLLRGHVLAECFGLADSRVFHGAPRVEVQVIDVVEQVARIGAGGHQGLRDGVEQFIARKDGGGGAAVRRGQRADGMDEVAFATLEEFGDFVGGSGFELFLAAFGHDPGEHGAGRAAEGVADEVDLRVVAGRAEVFQDAFIGTAETLDAVFLGMIDTVVDAAAEDVGIEFAGTFPHAGEGAESGLIDFIAEVFVPVLSEVLREGSEILVQIAEIVFLIDAQETVDEDGRIISSFRCHFCFPSLMRPADI